MSRRSGVDIEGTRASRVGWRRRAWWRRLRSSADAATDGQDRIGPTAHYTAYTWHRLGLPHAASFKTPTGRVLYWGLFVAGEWMTRLSSRLPSLRDYLEYRHRLIDATLAAEDPDALVEIGAGLSHRGVAWAADRGVPVVEFDLPPMAAVKRAMVRRLPPTLRAKLAVRHLVLNADVLAPGFSAQLADALASSRRPVVVAEGLMSYFDDAGRQRFLAAVAAGLRAAGGGLLVCDTHSRDAQARAPVVTRVYKLVIIVLTRRRRALGGFRDVPALREAFADAGFDRVAFVRASDHTAREPALRRLPPSLAHVVTARVTAG